MTGAAPALPSSEVTWEEFLLLLEDPENKNVELIDGKAVVSTASWIHQRIALTLMALLWNWIHAGDGRGEATFTIAVKITEKRGCFPDVAWYSEQHLTEGRSAGSPPDLAVEVLSPSTRAFDIVRERADYARVGVRELWLIDPDGPAALVLRREGAEFVVADDLHAGGELTSPLLPGLAIRVGALVER